MRRLAAASLIAISLLFYPSARSQGGLIAPAAGFVLEQQLDSDISDRIRQAEAAADFATLNLLLRIKSSLEAVRETGGSLIDQTSFAANQQSYQTYLQIRAAIKAPGDSITQLETAAAQAQQVAESLPFAKGRTYIINYGPRVAPVSLGDLRLRINGVNFDRSRPEAQLNGKPLKVQSVGMQELLVIVPAQLLVRHPNAATFNEVKVRHLARTSFLSRIFGERIERTLPIAILPETAAMIRVTGQLRVTKREYKEFTADVYVAGYGPQRRIQLPGEGWKFDLGKHFDTTQGHGEAGTCYSVDRHASTSEGIIVLANNSKYGPRYKRKDGYVTCQLNAQIYREVTTSEPFVLPQHVLRWGRPAYIELPHDRSSFIAMVELFDGTEEPVDGARVHHYFESSLVGDQLRIEPRVPRWPN